MGTAVGKALRRACQGVVGSVCLEQGEQEGQGGEGKEGGAEEEGVGLSFKMPH